MQPQEELIQFLAEELQFSEQMAALLVNRDIMTAEAARSFLYDGMEQLSSPWQLSGVRAAVERIIMAMKAQEQIVIYGDYDVDGICSVVLLVETFARLGYRADYYVPNRFSEGYEIGRASCRERV